MDKSIVEDSRNAAPGDEDSAVRAALTEKRAGGDVSILKPGQNVYVVTSVNYEYNDEVFSTPENGGGFPRRVFASWQEANEVVKQMTFDAVCTEFVGRDSRWRGSFQEYSYDEFDLDEISDLLEDDSRTTHRPMLRKDLTDDEIWRFIDWMHGETDICFFQVETVEFG